jgi:hypothetical protein
MKFPDDDVGPEPTLPKHTRVLELLEMIYRGEFKASPQQMRAAIEALPYEVPKLSAVGVGYFTHDTFAERLDRAIDQSQPRVDRRRRDPR